jgi:hypothetical protein
MKKILVIITLIMSITSMSHANEAAIDVYPSKCIHGIQQQPKGSFAAMVFCDDAAGTHIGVICYDAGVCQKSEYPDGNRFDGWALDNRFWQTSTWGLDVTNFVWSQDNKYLFIATNSIYGSGGLYQLDLERRIEKQLLPINKSVSSGSPGSGYSIISLSKDGKSLTYKAENETKIRTLKLQ